MRGTMRESDRTSRFAEAALVILAALMILCLVQRDWAGAAFLSLLLLADAGALAFYAMRRRQEDNAPRVAVRAVVTERFTDRTGVSRGVYATYYYLTLRLDGQGERRFEVSPADYARLKPGDEGGLIYQGTHLIAFEPDGVRLMPEEKD